MTKINSGIASPISHKKILRYTGIIGFLLPVFLLLGTVISSDCQVILPSISAYYHSVMGDYFVGSLSAIAFCLFVYKGYDNTDYVLSNIAAFALLGVAFCPTYINNIESIECFLRGNAENTAVSRLHYISASVFFLILTFFCLIQFPKGIRPFTRMKLIRNRMYYFSGGLILLSILSISIYVNFYEDLIPTFIFWAEVAALWAFSTAWLVKGEMVFKDQQY